MQRHVLVLLLLIRVGAPLAAAGQGRITSYNVCYTKLLRTDPNGAIVDANPAFTEITGFEREEVLGENPRILNSGRQTGEFYAAMWESLRSRGHWNGEIWNRRKDGVSYNFV